MKKDQKIKIEKKVNNCLHNPSFYLHKFFFFIFHYQKNTYNIHKKDFQKLDQHVSFIM